MHLQLGKRIYNAYQHKNGCTNASAMWKYPSVIGKIQSQLGKTHLQLEKYNHNLENRIRNWKNASATWKCLSAIGKIHLQLGKTHLQQLLEKLGILVRS